MPIKLKITNSVLKRFEKIKAKCSGCLFGFIHQGTLIVLGFNIETTNSSVKSKQIQYNFPTNVDLCGFVKFGMLTDTEAHKDDILKNIDITDNPIMLTCDIGTLVGLKASLFKHGQFHDVSYEVIMDEELYENYFIANLECYLQVICDETEESIHSNFTKLRIKMSSGAVAFNIKNFEIYLTSGNLGTNIQGIDSESTIADLVEYISNKSNDSVKEKKKKNQTTSSRTEYKIIHVETMLKKTKDKSDETLNRSSGKITVYENTEPSEIPLNINTLSMIYKETKAIDLYDVLVESVSSSLRLLESNLIDQKKVRSDKPLQVLVPYHFYPDDLKHYFTCVYPDDVLEDDPYLVAKRKKLHHLFGLPLTKPYFRRANSVSLNQDDISSKILINPHIGLKSKVSDGVQYLVSGKYSYHHYMQDNFNDNGWGCAYRSLQTLCSWFRWQGYSDRAIPTHLEIQEYLVKINDKPKTFIGSKQWIGSMEVSMCLNGFLNVDSKILNVSTGAELKTKGPELQMHFLTVGTPIMIGGGVLAHTILGIDYNQSTGDIKFLILDPHYTGGEDLQLIQSKGWCGWKGPEFWSKTDYYNLCMPQLPTIF